MMTTNTHTIEKVSMFFIALMCVFMLFLAAIYPLNAVFYTGVSIGSFMIVFATGGKDLYDAYKAVTPAVDVKPDLPLATKARQRNGYVYLLRTAHDVTLFKIGRTSNPDNRIKTFNVKLPFQVEYEHLIPTVDMYALESELHQRFASQRLEGEFFRLSSEDVQYIKSLGA
jgi:hypothetical protein